MLLRSADIDTAYELGGPSFTLDQLAGVVSVVTETRVGYRDLTGEQHVEYLRSGGMDYETARLVAALDESTARRDLHTTSPDLADLIGREPVGVADVVRRA